MASNANGEPTTPEELNDITDDALQSHVSSVLSRLTADVDDPDTRDVPPVARFITADVLLRLHNIIADARLKGDRCGGWSKQATLAKVVACFTGVKLKRSDADFIGNAEDSFLHHYRKELRRARNSDSQEVSRGRRKGLEVQPTRATQQMQRIFQCRFGGVPRMVDMAQMPVHKQPIPARRLLVPLQEVNMQLQQHIMEMKALREESERQSSDNLSTLCLAVEHERSAREHAERRASEATAAQESAAAADAARVQALKAQLSAADHECKRTLGQLARLGSQLAAAHVEVARAQEREERARKQVEQAVASAVHAQAEETEKATLQIATFKKRSKIAELDRSRAEGQLARLGSQIAAAHVEVAKAQEREEKVRNEAGKAAADAADAQAEAVAKVTQRLQVVQAERRNIDTQRKLSEAQVQRLGSQLGIALVQAARAAESAKEAHTTAEVLRTRLAEQKASASYERAHLRELKSKMAKRAREANKRAESSDLMKAELERVRSKLRAVRKELNYTQVQLNLNASQNIQSDCSENDDGQSASESEADDSGGEAQEAATALKRIRSMPTWRPVRGKGQGKGEAKLEWGTRLIVYSLLALMVPPSAVGVAIVAIVKRTAPWLKPAAPTNETVRRCRFELRFLEEVRNMLCAHVIASCDRTPCITVCTSMVL